MTFKKNLIWKILPFERSTFCNSTFYLFNHLIILPFVRKPSQLGHHGNKCQDVDPEQEITVHDAKIIRNSLPQLTASAQIIVGEMADDADGKSTHGDDVLMNFAKYRRNFT